MREEGGEEARRGCSLYAARAYAPFLELSLVSFALLTLTPHIACLAALSFAIEVWGMSMGTMMIVHVLVL